MADRQRKSYVVTTEPSVEPVTFADMQAQIRLNDIAEQSIIEGWITAARKYGEDIRCQRSFITQSWTLRYDRFPREILLPMGPVQSVTSLSYLDGAGDAQTWDSENYQVDTNSDHARVKPVEGIWWPVTQASTYNAVTVVYKAGYGDAASDVPQGIKDAIRLIVAHLDKFREDVITGTIATRVQMAAGLTAADALFQQYNAGYTYEEPD